MSFMRSNSCRRKSSHNPPTHDRQIYEQITSSLALSRKIYWATFVKLSVRRSSGSWFRRSARKCRRSSSCCSNKGRGEETRADGQGLKRLGISLLQNEEGCGGHLLDYAGKSTVGGVLEHNAVSNKVELVIALGARCSQSLDMTCEIKGMNETCVLLHPSAAPPRKDGQMTARDALSGFRRGRGCGEVRDTPYLGAH